MLELWGDVFDLWSSYSLDQLDYMSLPQGHPLFTRRENLRQQKRHNEDDEKTQPGEMDQLLHDPLEEATLREIRAQFWEDLRQQKQRREDDEAAQQIEVAQRQEPHDDDREPVPITCQSES